MFNLKLSLPHMFNSTIDAHGINQLGLFSARTFGSYAGASAVTGAAAMVGSYWHLAGVSLVGSAALYIPTLMLKQSLIHLGFMNNILNQAINMAFSCGSAALGAAVMGFAVKPFLICALVGCITVLCLKSLARGEAPKQIDWSAGLAF